MECGVWSVECGATGRPRRFIAKARAWIGPKDTACASQMSASILTNLIVSAPAQAPAKASGLRVTTFAACLNVIQRIAGAEALQDSFGSPRQDS